MVTPEAAQVAASLTETMARTGVSQNALATATGIPRTTLIRKLKGHAAFNVDELTHIAAHLDLSMADLLRDAA